MKGVNIGLFMSLCLVLDASLSYNKIPVALHRKLSRLSTHDFAKKHLRRGGVPSFIANDGMKINGEKNKHREGSVRGEELVFTQEGSIQESNVLAQSLTAAPSGCVPQLQPVRLPPDSDSSVMYWPSCVQLERCTGCCGHDALQCQPTAQEKTSVEVMKSRYTGGEEFVFEGMVTMLMDKHTACSCQCVIQPHHCHPLLHSYNANECSCRCRNEQEATSCLSPRTWVIEECACKCPRITCNSNEIFNENSCRCVPQSFVRPATLLSATTPPCGGVNCRYGYAALPSTGCRCRRV